MAINLSDELHAATTKGKLAAAKEIYLEGDSKNLQQSSDEQDSHLSLHDSEISEAKSRLDNHDTFNQNQTQKNTELDANMKKLNDRDDQITELVKGVTATGGASVATAVSYDNSASKLTAATAQGAIDELQAKKFDKANVLQELGTSQEHVLSQNIASDNFNRHSVNIFGSDDYTYIKTWKQKASVDLSGVSVGDTYKKKEDLNNGFCCAKVRIYKGCRVAWRVFPTDDMSTSIVGICIVDDNDKVMFVSQLNNKVQEGFFDVTSDGYIYANNHISLSSTEKAYYVHTILAGLNVQADSFENRINELQRNKFEKKDISQGNGDADDEVMSQRAATDNYENIKTILGHDDYSYIGGWTQKACFNTENAVVGSVYTEQYYTEDGVKNGFCSAKIRVLAGNNISWNVFPMSDGGKKVRGICIVDDNNTVLFISEADGKVQSDTYSMEVDGYVYANNHLSLEETKNKYYVCSSSLGLTNRIKSLEDISKDLEYLVGNEETDYFKGDNLTNGKYWSFTTNSNGKTNASMANNSRFSCCSFSVLKGREVKIRSYCEQIGAITVINKKGEKIFDSKSYAVTLFDKVLDEDADFYVNVLTEQLKSYYCIVLGAGIASSVATNKDNISAIKKEIAPNDIKAEIKDELLRPDGGQQKGYASMVYNVKGICANLICTSPTTNNEYLYTFVLYDENDKPVFYGPKSIAENPATINPGKYNASTLWIQYYKSDGVPSCEYEKLTDRISSIEQDAIPFVRKKVYIYTSDTEREIFDKLNDAVRIKNCDVYWETGEYSFTTIFDYLTTIYPDAHEIPIGGNCRYYFNNSIIKGTIENAEYKGNASIFGARRSVQDYELHDGTLIMNGGVYCVHDEANALAGLYKHLYENMTMQYNKGNVTQYLSKCIGGGTGLNGIVTIKGCTFECDNDTKGSSGYSVSWHGNLLNDNPINFELNVYNSYFAGGLAVGNIKENDSCIFRCIGNSLDKKVSITTPERWKSFVANNEIRVE